MNPRFPGLRERARFASAALLFTSLACAAPAAFAGASNVPTGFLDQSVAGALSEPISLSQIPDAVAGHAPRVVFIEQRTAKVKVIVGGTIFTAGTVPGVVTADEERGLLGVAVDPNWPVRPYIYVHCTDGRSGNHINVSRFTMTGDLAGTGTGQIQFDPASRYDLINNIPDNAPQHNGGTVRFGPDKMLYVSIGDDETGCPAQDPTTFYGKILRLDVSRLPATPGGPAPRAILAAPGNPFPASSDSIAMLVYVVGLRNPFRFQIDALSGTLYISDVGENTWEELDRVPNGGMDMGWPLMEGPATYHTCTITPPAPLTAPITYYDHSTGVVIICGGLYHVPASGALRFPASYEGACFFLDYYTGILRCIKGSGSNWSAMAPPAPGQPDPNDWGTGFGNVADMLEMSDGTLWYVRQSVNGVAATGEIRRLSGPPAADVSTRQPAGLEFAKPRPSPSSASVTFAWAQPRAAAVRLEVYDLGGRLVRTLLADATLEAGAHEVVWDRHEDSGRTAPAGLYFARLQAGDATRQARLTLVR